MKASTITARKRNSREQKTVYWDDVWETHKDDLVSECIPNADMLDKNLRCYHALKDGEVLYFIRVNESYVNAFFTEVLYGRMKRDADYFDVLKDNVKAVRQKEAENELKNQVKALAKVRYQALPENDTTTIEELENQIRESLGM